ncbi:MAG: NAD(P)-dependent oxidoreductase [Verrucomicrobiota bacterium]|jgi:nucleoside-diphosphate-sugar epimerase
MITGSSGFIGGWVWKRLAEQGHEVIGLDKAGPPEEFGREKTCICDILDGKRLRSAIKESQPDAVIHLAARVDLDEKHEIRGYAANIDGVRNLLDSVRQAPSVRRVIYTSSQLVCKVGHVPKSMEEYCPDTLYGESKALTEQIVRQADGGTVEWCLVRPTTVWGPGMSAHYQQMLDLVSRGVFFHCGSGKLHKSYGYAGNIAHQYATLLAARPEAVHRQTFYLADYEPLSLRDYLDSLARELGAKPIRTVPLPAARTLAYLGDVMGALRGRSFPFNSFRLRNILTEYVFDLSRTRAVCGDLPISFGSGVRATAEWYRGLGRGGAVQSARKAPAAGWNSRT